MKIVPYTNVVRKSECYSRLTTKLKPYEAIVLACEENGSMVVRSNFVGNMNGFLRITNSLLVAYQQPLTKKLLEELFVSYQQTNKFFVGM